MSAILICVSTLITNFTIDPLWYFSGNLITGINPHFNERQSKINLLLRHAKDYNCIILGSSRSTLMPSDSFAPYRCFNLSFSGGQIEEFIAYADYLDNIDLHPQLVVIGVDGFNFRKEDRDKPTIPDFVQKKLFPPGVLTTYLSIDSLAMSWQSLFKRGTSRYYNRDFDCVIYPDAPRFDPDNFEHTEGQKRIDAIRRLSIPYIAKNADLYGVLVKRFRNARVIGYVPPISAWHINDMAHRGLLDGYVNALYQTAQNFPRMVDFSVPNIQTIRTDNTYDGSHYSVSTNRDIAHILLNPPPPSWGIEVTGISRDVYPSRYREALLAFAGPLKRRASAQNP